MAVWLLVLYCAIFCHYFGQVSAIFLPLREYSGSTFFDAWDFYGNIDNTTWGNVTYQDRTNATSKRLTFINEAGNAIVKVDNTTNIASAELVSRDSIRLTSQDAYGLDTLLVIDALHIPYGCSVWPSFWTLGANELWPLAGEIDLIEAINLMPGNQVALHSTPGCFQARNPLQLGSSLENNCSTDQGCIVQESKPNSFGEGFAQAGGGIFALQIDVTGIFTWFFGRDDIPENIRSATSTSPMDISQWGTPSSSYPASGCNITEFFGPQQLVLLTTLCGVWAGVPSIYKDTCHTPTNSCVNDNVVGPGSNYDTAYWEIRYIRAYLAQGNESSLATTSGSAVPESTEVIAQTVAQTFSDVPTPLATKFSSTTPTTSGSTQSSVSLKQVFITIMFSTFFYGFLY